MSLWKVESAEHVRKEVAHALRMPCHSVRELLPMNVRPSTKLFAAVGIAAVTGCSLFHPSATTPTGHVQRTHSKPGTSAGYGDWDPSAVAVKLDRYEDTTPVGTSQVYVATVVDEDGEPLSGRRVEWMIADGGVGDIVEVDETGWTESRGHKVNNKFAVTHTNTFSYVLDRGTDDPADDIYLEPGQTWAVVNSPVEGETFLHAFAPAVYNWENHRVVAKHNWFDVAWEMPAVSQNEIGGERLLSTRVYRYTDGTPLENYLVRYEIVSGPTANLDGSPSPLAQVFTDDMGFASVVLAQDAPIVGTNDIRVTVIRPENPSCCSEAVTIAQGFTANEWLGPNIQVTKAAPPVVNTGDEFVIPITVTNDSSVNANDVVVTDMLPEGLEFVDSDPPAQFDNDQLIWDLDNIPPGETKQVQMRVRAKKPGTQGSFTEAAGSNDTFDRDFAETVVLSPKLVVTHDGPMEVLSCDPIQYVITVSNIGDGVARNVVIEEDLAQGLNIVNGLAPQFFRLGDLQPGQAREVSFTVESEGSGAYVNQVMARAEGDVIAQDQLTTIVRQPRLTITKFGPDERYVGKSADYEITVTNVGDTIAYNTLITDSVPAGMSFVNANSGGTYANGQIAWTIPQLNPGESTTVRHSLKAFGQGTARATAWARATCAEASALSTTQVNNATGLALEVVDLEDPIEVGDETTYEIRVTNQGLAEATNIMIACELPNGQSLVTTTGPTNAKNNNGAIDFAPLPSLAPGRHATYRVVVKSNAKGDVRFRTVMTSDQLGENVTETESTFMY